MPIQQKPLDEESEFRVLLTTASGHTFVLCGRRDPAIAGAALVRDALAITRRRRFQRNTSRAVEVPNVHAA